jgi:outer membrane receptor protein involved in Fe transport
MRYPFLTTFIFIFCFFLHSTASAQSASIEGIVRDAGGERLSNITLTLKEDSRYSAISNSQGDYKILAGEGQYTLIARAIGYRLSEQAIELRPGQKLVINITLEEETTDLNEVVIAGKSALQEVDESAFNVVAVDAKALHNTTLDLSQALDRVSGIRIRQNGGVGSATNLSLNGFSGRHVKFFIDGVPMEGFGSAFQINNIPINMAERIEVYKGVVPINFGSDALGGAVNIVTQQRSRSFLDASYSYGSFNTHKSYINAGHTSTSGITFNMNVFQNYSDNNYWVDAQILDLEDNLFLPDKQRVRRFNDQYHNETVIAQVGVLGKPYADRLMLGFTWGNEYAEIQHAADMSFVYGERFRESNTLMPTLSYRKRDLFTENLDVSLNANYNFGSASNIDTARRRYNWLGEFRNKLPNASPGELAYSIYEFKDRNGAVNANATYTLKDRHAFTLNNVFTSFSRIGHDEAEPNPDDAFPRESMKNVLGFGYKFAYNPQWNTSLFLKQYSNKVNAYVDPAGGNQFDHFSATTNNTGYGVASTYFITPQLQVKGSYEKTYRLPTGGELFGSGDGIEIGNVSLKPENSDNFNAGLNYSFLVDQQHAFSVDGNFIYRDIKDYIRRSISQSRGTAQSINEGHVRNIGVDAEVRYSYGELFTVGANATYQNIRNKLMYRDNSTVVSTVYNDRVPNQPYIYGNADATFFFNDALRKGNTFSLSYNLLYVHQFYYDWPSYGGITIPSQFSHDLFGTYSVDDGRYNISLECRNIFDSDLFDNYSLQKPGRSFAVKLRYFISK